MPASIPVVDEVADLLHSVNRRIRGAARAELESIGLTPAQWRALRAISRFPAGLKMSDLADRLRIARRSATSVVDELADRALVTRRADPADRRSVIVASTPRGRDVVEAWDRQWRQAATRTLGRLSRSDLATLRELLRRIDET